MITRVMISLVMIYLLIMSGVMVLDVVNQRDYHQSRYDQFHLLYLSKN